MSCVCAEDGVRYWSLMRRHALAAWCTTYQLALYITLPLLSRSLRQPAAGLSAACLYAKELGQVLPDIICLVEN